MKIRTALLFLALIFLFTSAPVSAANRDWEQGDFYGVKINSSDAQPRIEMLGVRTRDRMGDSIVVRITADQKKMLERNGFELSRLSGNPAMGGRSADSCSDFAQNEDVIAIFDALADDYPDIVQRITLGYSVEDREIAGIIISANPGIEEDEPEVRVVGAHHGDECMAVEISLEIADYLIGHYGQTGYEDVTDLVDNMEIMVAPLINPDGNATDEDGYSTRYNANGVDLNRDYGYQWRNDSSDTKPFGEPEVRAVVDDALLNNYVLSYTFHTVADYINYPWNLGYSSGTYFAAADDDELKYISDIYAAESGAEPTNGCEWYMTNGDTNDWSYGSRGDLDITIETADYNVALTAPKNRDGVLETFKLLNRGIRGVVTNAVTGDPVEAMVLFDEPKWQIYTDPLVGDYHKYVLPGTYSFTVWAPGYAAVRVQNVSVSAGEMERRDVQLTPNYRYYALQAIGVITNITSSGNTWQYQTFGPPDGVGMALRKVDEYWFESEGEIVLDMNTRLDNIEGPDLKVYEAGAKPGRAYKVYVAMSYDADSWTYLGRGLGDSTFEIGAAGREYLSYVKIKDDNTSSDFVLDAVEYAPVIEDGDVDGDADPDPDPDADPDPDQDQNPDGDDTPDGDDVPDGDDAPDGDDVPDGDDAPDGDDLPDGDDTPDGDENDCITQDELGCWSITLIDEESCYSTVINSHPALTEVCNTVSLPVFEICGDEQFNLVLEKQGDSWAGPQDCRIKPEGEEGLLIAEGDCGFGSEISAVTIDVVDCGELAVGSAEIAATDCTPCDPDGDEITDGDEVADGDTMKPDGDESPSDGDETPDGDISVDGDGNDNNVEEDGSSSGSCSSGTNASALPLLLLALMFFLRRKNIA